MRRAFSQAAGAAGGGRLLFGAGCRKAAESAARAVRTHESLSSPIRQIVAFVCLACAMTSPPTAISAQEPGPAQRSLQDGVFSEDQADRGEKLFDRRCAGCHMTDEFLAPSFMASFEGVPVSILYDVVSTGMPQDNPGSLKPLEYVDLLTYLFRLNGVPTGAEELESDAGSLSNVIIERPPGPHP